MVEIGIPAYNSALYVGDAIRGCLMQQYDPIRVIVADDCSSDNTVDAVQHFQPDKRIQLSRNEKNIGRVGNYRHILYDLAQSDWYINLDADDYFVDPHFIKHGMEMIKANGDNEIAFYQGNHNIERLRKTLPQFTDLNDEEILVDGKEYFIHFPQIQKNTHCATLYNRTKALPLNFYSADGCLYADFHSLSRLALTGKVILSSKKVAAWRQHPGNASKTLDESKLQKELAALEDVALFAANYLPAPEISKWLSKMKEYYRVNFIYQHSTYAPGWVTIRYIMRNWRFNWLYPRYVFKNFLLMIRRLFIGKK